MNQKLTLGQRFIAEEPDLFKIVKFLAFMALFAAALLTKLSLGSDFTRQILTIGGSVAYLVASFTVKDANALITAGFTPESVMQLLAGLPDQINSVKAAIASPLDANAILNTGFDQLNKAIAAAAPVPDFRKGGIVDAGAVVKDIAPGLDAIRTQLATNQDQS